MAFDHEGSGRMGGELMVGSMRKMGGFRQRPPLHRQPAGRPLQGTHMEVKESGMQR